MKRTLDLEIQSQPNDSSCGPTCLAAVYRYWNDPVELPRLLAEIGELSGGGTLAVQLGCHALARNYDATITTYKLQVFDPSWFRSEDGVGDNEELSDKLVRQLEIKLAQKNRKQTRLRVATQSYLCFLALGGRVQMRPLDEHLISDTLSQGMPILCGLSATYLYSESRERTIPPDAHGLTSIADDVGGDPTGHFVILYGFDSATGEVQIADPLHPNPFAPTNKYVASLSKVTAAILLGIVTYDASLLTISPRNGTPHNHKPLNDTSRENERRPTE